MNISVVLGNIFYSKRVYLTILMFPVLKAYIFLTFKPGYRFTKALTQIVNYFLL